MSAVALGDKLIFSHLKEFFRKHLSNKFCAWDPKAQAFNNFYQELLQSEVYQNLAKEIHGHPSMAYNLNTADIYEDLEVWKNNQDGPFADIGCGLGVFASIPKMKDGDDTVFGWDFSKIALHSASQFGPQNSFFIHHQNLPQPLILQECPAKVAIDSLYPTSSRPGKGDSFQKILFSLLKSNTQSLYVVQNFYENENFEVRGFRVDIQDFTESFSQLVDSWKKALEGPDVQEDAKKFSLLWSTIEREFSQHQRSLHENRVKRLRLIYSKL